MNYIHKLNNFWDSIKEPYRFLIFLFFIAIPLSGLIGYGDNILKTISVALMGSIIIVRILGTAQK